MKATVDLLEVLDLLLAQMQEEARTATDAPEDYVTGRWVGIEKAANLVRSVLALPSVSVEPEL